MFCMVFLENFHIFYWSSSTTQNFVKLGVQMLSLPFPGEGDWGRWEFHDLPRVIKWPELWAERLTCRERPARPFMSTQLGRRQGAFPWPSSPPSACGVWSCSQPLAAPAQTKPHHCERHAIASLNLFFHFHTYHLWSTLQGEHREQMQQFN